MTRKEKLPPGVSSFLDRHGKRRYRWRRRGEQRYFAAHPTSREGRAELAAFLAGQDNAPPRWPAGTVGNVAARYFASLDFTGGKSDATALNARRIVEPFVAEYAAYRVADFRFDHIEAIVAKAALPRVEKGRRRGGPHAANNLRGELKPFFAYAIKLLDLRSPNPVDQAAKAKLPKGGFHSWTEAEIAQYRARHALGTSARLALEIFLWTWQRRGDASTFGPGHVAGGLLRYTQAKTNKTLTMPVAPRLQAAIAAMPAVGIETYLVTAYGKPFSKAGLGNKMREWCDAAGLPHCTAHGLRKAAARRAAEAGASNQMLKAAGGWSGDSEVGVYTAAVDQEAMAGATLAPVIAMDRG